MSLYKNRMFENFKDFLEDNPDNNDRIIMEKKLKPLILELKKNNIDCPNDFVDILNRFNIFRPTITEFMKKIIVYPNNNFEITNRLLSHSNKFEKNIILTYIALNMGESMLDKFKFFISEVYPYFGNKDNLFEQINKEINIIQEKSSKKPNSLSVQEENEPSNLINQDFSFLENPIPNAFETISDGYFGEFDDNFNSNEDGSIFDTIYYY